MNVVCQIEFTSDPLLLSGIRAAVERFALQSGFDEEQSRLVTLAVDAANTPARRTYEAMGFAAYSTRDVWIRVFRRADQEGHFALPSR